MSVQQISPITKSVTDRDRALDTLRAGAILYIVGFWHLFDYVEPANLHKTAATELFTYGVLGLFCFISGYLLAKHKLLCFQDVLRFYQRRLLKIYPMYAIALTAFLTIGLIELDTFFRTILATNMIWLASLPTLWFVALILTLYAITPLYLIRYSLLKTILLTILLYGLMLSIITTNAPLIDYRFPLLLPAFAFGISAGRHPQIRHWLTHPIVVIAAFACFWLTVSPFYQNFDLSFDARVLWFLRIDLAIFACIPLLWAVGQALSSRVPPRLLYFLSYSSFATYLLHRIVFRLGLMAYQPHTLYSSLFYLMGIVLPLTIAVSYLFQKLYDRAVAHIVALRT